MKNSISFGAKLVQTTPILKYDCKTKKYTPVEVSFVNINPSSDNDKNAIKRLTHEWFDTSYTQPIFEDILELRSEKPRIKSQFFALTTQKENLKELDSSQILGIAEMSLNNEKAPYLEYLQVNPDITDAYFEPLFKHVGTGILNSFKNMYKSITLSSRASTVSFYMKNGFEQIEPVLLRFRWIKK